MNNSRWILCPSKTFPGKFYYFNVSNGETAWSLSDAEKSIINKDGGFHRVIDSHHHPEPTSPPTNAPVKTFSNNLTRFSISNIEQKNPTPVFGQSVFPKPFTVKTEPNIAWTPIQIQVPIVFAPEGKEYSNQDTQTSTNGTNYETRSMELGKDMWVQAGYQPLSQRFVNYENPVISFNKNNNIENRQQFDKFYTSTPVKENLINSVASFNTTASSPEIFQSKNYLSFSDIQPKFAQPKQLIWEPKLNIEMPSKTIKNVFSTPTVIQKPALFNCNKVGFGQSIKANVTSKKVLKNNDLRMLLMTKKRKSLDVPTSGEIKRIKTSNPEPLKKRVSFNLGTDNSCMDFKSADFQANFENKYAPTVKLIKDLAGPGLRKDHWCLVVDVQVLLEEFIFLDKFVQIDPECRLLIPSSVFTEISSISKGESWDRTRVSLARNVIRRLVYSHIIVKTAADKGTGSPGSDAILKCCVETMDQKIHLILISNDQELLTTAKCYPIRCYNINDIKNGLAPERKALDFKPMKITIRNNTESKPTQNGVNHFGQNSSECDLNDIEKDMIRRFEQIDTSSKEINEKSNMTKNPLTDKNNIRNSLTQKTKPFDFNKIKITITNDNESKSEQNKVQNCFGQTPIKESDGLNDVEKEIMRRFKQIDTNYKEVNQNFRKTNNSMPENKIATISNENLIVIDKSPMKNSRSNMLNRDPRALLPSNNTNNSKLTNESSRITNKSMRINTKTNNNFSENSTIADLLELNLNPITNSLPKYTRTMENSKTSNTNFKVSTTEEKASFWRSCNCDITQTTREEDNGIPKKVQTAENQNANGTASAYFQSPPQKIVFSKLKTNRKSQTEMSSLENGQEDISAMFNEKQKVNKEISHENSIFQSTDTNFRLNNVEEPLNSTKYDSKMATRSIFEMNALKKLPSIQPVINVVENSFETLDLSSFYVTSKIMEKRLTESFDEWLCIFKQNMEEYLSGILEKLTIPVIKLVAPPWSLYEALQCTKNAYKKHTVIRDTIDQLCGFLYNANYRNDYPDNFKKNINPNEFLKAIGCGIHLVKYLKNIGQHSDIFDTEESLVKMLDDIQNPLSDINEPLIRHHSIDNNEESSVRPNFIKKRSVIIDYLKKHYPAWQNYEEEQIKIDRTFGKDLKLIELDKNGFTDHQNKTNFVDVATKNVEENATNTVGNIPTTNTVLAEIMKINNTSNSKTKNVDNATNKQSEQARKKLLELHKDFQNEKKSFKDILKNVPKITNTFINKCTDTKALEIYNDKPNKCVGQVEEIQNNNLKKPVNNNFKIDSKMLEVKITITNDFKLNKNEVAKKHYIESKFEPKDIPNMVEINNNRLTVESGGVLNRKIDKDHMIDNGLNEDLQERTNSVVKSFSTELDDYIQNIHRLLDGAFQEFRNGQAKNETKQMYKRKTLEANIMISKIINGLHNMIHKQMKNEEQKLENASDKRLLKSMDTVVQCLERAQMLHKTLNTMLSV